VLRVVLDANVVVSGWLQAAGPSGRVLSAANTGRFRTVVSQAIVEEYRRSLGYPKIRRRLRVSPRVVDTWLDTLVHLSDVVPGARDVAVVRTDPDDDKYLAAALEGMASLVISGDRDLLDLETYEELRIMSPLAFIELLDQGAI
jgi:putative PIN family toxin of toxin-antitoxin system